MSTIPDFGQAASDYVPAEFNDDDVWILKFKVGETLVRICPAEMVNAAGKTVFGTEAWPTEREHYDEDIPGGAFPCAERFGIVCTGCSHPNKKVRDRSRQYYINVLDENGHNRVYKMGVKLFKIFQGREQRALGRDPNNKQPLSDRDFIIIRTGSSMNDTSYDPEPGEAYPVDGGWPEDLHDIKEVLKAKYAAALEFHTGGEPVAAKEEEPQDTPAARPTRIKAAAEPAPEPTEEAAAARSGENGSEPTPIWFKNPTAEDLEDATSEELKAFLTRREAEFPARAPRARLLKAAKDLLEPPY
ncbi:MAG TPA: hypothetical protein VNN23_10675 [Ornithinibacter sp.]|nr:hypothetical protein [Ornithinibacter sp.]